MLSLLTECTINMLKIIHEMYREQRITYEEFYDLTKVKVKYLFDRINIIPYKDRITVNEILSLCTNLIEKNENGNLIKTNSKGIDILQ